MRRHALGIFGLLLLITGIVILASPGTAGNKSMYASICMHAGLVLCAIWLALPQLKALSKTCPPWMIVLIVVAILVAIITKSPLIIFPIVGGILVLHFIGWLFKPLPPSKPKAKSPQKPAEPLNE